MNDPYRITDIERAPAEAPAPVRRGGFVRPLLWVLLVVSGAANSVTSFGGVHAWIHLGFGVVTLLCVVALVMHYLRGRR